MARHKKLFARLQRRPKDFTWDEAETLLKGIGYKKMEGGGSRVKFYNQEKDSLISFDKPHPENTLKDYVIKRIIGKLEAAGYMSDE